MMGLQVVSSACKNTAMDLLRTIDPDLVVASRLSEQLDGG